MAKALLILLLLPSLTRAQVIDVDQAQQLFDVRAHEYGAAARSIAATRPVQHSRQLLVEVTATYKAKCQKQLEAETNKLNLILYGNSPDKVGLLNSEHLAIVRLQNALDRVNHGEIVPDIFPAAAVNIIHRDTIIGAIGYNKRFVQRGMVSVPRSVLTEVGVGQFVARTVYDTRESDTITYVLTAPLPARVEQIASDNQMLLVPFDPQPNQPNPVPIRQVLNITNYPTQQLRIGSTILLSGPYYVSDIRSDGAVINIEQMVPISRPSIQPTDLEFASYKSEAGAIPDDYQDLAKAFLYEVLKDPYSAHYDFDDPKPWKRFNTNEGRWHYGWLSEVGVDAKNSFGAYAGREPFWFFFRGGMLEDSGDLYSSAP